MGSLRLRLALAGGAGIAAALLLAVAVSYQHERQQQLAAAQVELLQQQQRVADGLDAVFERTEQRARELSAQIRTVAPDRTQLIAMLAAKLLNDGESVQLGVMLEARNPVDRQGRLAISVIYGAEGLRVVDFMRLGYPYWTMPWYQRTLASANGWWSDPYFNDYAGGIDTVTFDYPLRDAQGQNLGMLSVSIALDRLAEIVKVLGQAHAASGAESLLTDARGKLLFVSDPAWRRAETLEAAAKQTDSLPAWVTRQPWARVPLQARAEHKSFVQVPLARVNWRAAGAIADAAVLAPLRHKTWVWGVLVLVLALLLGLTIHRLVRYLQRGQTSVAIALEGILDGRFAQGGASVLTRDWSTRLLMAFQQLRALQAQSRSAATEDHAVQLRAEGRRQYMRSMQNESLPEDRVFFGSGMQAHACGGVRSVVDDGGSFYGFASVTAGAFVFYLGEVAHAGLVPALQMGKLSTLLGVTARSAGTPADILDAVVAHVRQDDGIDFPTELLVGRVDLDKMTVAIANVGSTAAGAMWIKEQVPSRLALASAGRSQRELHGRWQEWRGACVPGARLLLGNWRQADDSIAALEAAAGQQASLPASRLVEDLLGVDAAFDVNKDRAVILLDIQHRD